MIDYMLTMIALEELNRFQLLCTSALTGLIWTMQLVHYPAFRYIDPQKAISFALFHQGKISFIVAPLMLGEVISALVLGAAAWSEHRSLMMYLINAVLIAMIWCLTFFQSMPCHQQLAETALLKDSAGLQQRQQIIDTLIRTNWLRTGCWSLKLLVCYLYLSH